MPSTVWLGMGANLLGCERERAESVRHGRTRKRLFASKEQHRTGRRTRFGEYKTGRRRYLGQQEINSRHDTLGGRREQFHW